MGWLGCKTSTQTIKCFLTLHLICFICLVDWEVLSGTMSRWVYTDRLDRMEWVLHRLQRLHTNRSVLKISRLLHLTLLLLNTTYPVLANWSGSALFVTKYVNFYQKLGSSNLIGEIRSEHGILIYSARQGLTKCPCDRVVRALDFRSWGPGFRFCTFLHCR